MWRSHEEEVITFWERSKIYSGYKTNTFLKHPLTGVRSLPVLSSFKWNCFESFGLLWRHLMSLIGSFIDKEPHDLSPNLQQISLLCLFNLAVISQISCGCSIGADPATRVSCESRRNVGKKAQKSSRLRYPQQDGTLPKKDVMTTPTSCRVGDLFTTISHRCSMTSPKPITDKLHHKQTNHKDKQTSRDQVHYPSRQDWLILRVGIHSQHPEFGSISCYMNPYHLSEATHSSLQR